ncbi:hypothetical protein AK812_SmicGene20312 [Symbiodinium microadriaticum]|uniref:Uncharacterized protein n=1 Tax=Symbiodinium microadriaticum TaxID=2951 RepID=A0A1Q9DQD5_SYMMI|nr:hypothetical protein AK812_SmicGene20312 [Symbiodinium microadriaticum]
MFTVGYCYENAAESAALLAIQDEQVIITFFDVLAKILVSAYVPDGRGPSLIMNLGDSENKGSCVQLLGTRLVAANMAEDVRRMVRYAGRDLRITEWNMKMQEISGLSREKAISMPLDASV